MYSRTYLTIYFFCFQSTAASFASIGATEAPVTATVLGMAAAVTSSATLLPVLLLLSALLLQKLVAVVVGSGCGSAVLFTMNLHVGNELNNNELVSK